MSNSISLKHKDTKTERDSIEKITEELVRCIPKTIKHFFPRFKSSLRKIEDLRKRTDYELSEIIMAAILLCRRLKQSNLNALPKDLLIRWLLKSTE